MTKHKYGIGKLEEALDQLIAPHQQGENTSFSKAFYFAQVGLSQLDEIEDPQAKEWIRTIDAVSDAEGVHDPTGGIKGSYAVKAEGLSHNEKQEFSTALKSLCAWFRERG